MADESDLRITSDLTIPSAELRFETSRSSGPGGQNVNKVESRVAILFDVDSSPTLTTDQKELIRSHLATRMSKKGILRVVAQKHRTQAANRKEVVGRFVQLLEEALEPEATRRATAIPRGTKRRRLDDKKRRGQLKKRRRDPIDWES
ncbi:MAG: alternative ribosome rescue aminoacyl-tRNA hydrolase ArfB [Thermoanaerobaculia bacterium]